MQPSYNYIFFVVLKINEEYNDKARENELNGIRTIGIYDELEASFSFCFVLFCDRR